MPKLIKLLYKHKYLISAIAITVAIAVLSLVRLGNNQPVSFKNSDKVAHFIAYFVLTFFWLLASLKFKSIKKTHVVLLCLLFGIIIEVLQSEMTSYRSCEYLDMVANLVGVLVGLLIFKLICTGYNKLIKLANY